MGPCQSVAVLAVFAGVLMLFFYRRRYPYGEHLVFAVHLHTVALVFLLVLIPVILLWPELLVRDVMAVYAVLLTAYVVIACRTFYRASWPASLAKGVALGAIDGVLIYFSILAGLDAINLLSA
jgi:hypothetical protein